VAFPRPSAPVVGEAALGAAAAQHTLVGAKRLLGRKYANPADAAWLDSSEGAGLHTCPLVAGEEAEGGVRMATSHERIASGLRKRGEPPRVVGGGADAKAKGHIERKHAPEEVCLYLPCISPASPLHLPCISPASPLHLPCISPVSRPGVPPAARGGQGARAGGHRARGAAR
jgi:hypothetical protein